jgi:hypothetical protein
MTRIWCCGPGPETRSRDKSSRAARCGINAHVQSLPCLVTGMIGSAASIHEMDLLRHGAMNALFGWVRAPSTLGSHAGTSRAAYRCASRCWSGG